MRENTRNKKGWKGAYGSYSGGENTIQGIGKPAKQKMPETGKIQNQKIPKDDRKNLEWASKNEQFAHFLMVWNLRVLSEEVWSFFILSYRSSVYGFNCIYDCSNFWIFK